MRRRLRAATRAARRAGARAALAMLAGLSLGAAAEGTGAEDTTPDAPRPPAIGIIMDDMGYRLGEGLRALELPGPIAFAFLPHTPNASRLASRARAQRRDILLHLPMEAQHYNELLGPGALTRDMARAELLSSFAASLLAVPGAIGVNNHMGSVLTRESRHMHWLMQALRGYGLFFVDSRTTRYSIAADAARDTGVPVLARDVFLDNVKDERYIRAQLTRLIRHARQRGAALGIAHPHAATLAVLTEELPRLSERGVELVGLPRLIERESARFKAATRATP